MSAVGQTNTKPELLLRRELHRRGMRYRIHVTVCSSPRRVVDIVFSRARVAVFVDGCFWHGCPVHASWPKKNAAFWLEKINANRARDADTNNRLRRLGWRVIRVWGHEPPLKATRRIERAVRSRLAHAK